MKASELRHRVSIERNVPVRGATGQPLPNWQLVAERWAAVHPQGGREFYGAKQIYAEMTHLITIRGPLEVLQTMRVRLRERVFDVIDVVDVENRGIEMRLVCKEGARQGN